TKNNVSYALINVNKGLVYLSTAVHNNAKTLSRINQYFNQSENDTRYQERVLNRVQIEMNQAVTMIENDMAIIDKLNDMLSNVISNNLNDVMKRLTVITIIMTVPTITAGLWGMNVALPFEDNVHGFSIILVGSIILSVIIYFIIDRINLFK
ncbi:magnesium transporter CorA family protein, partial [Aerococcus urinaeequi]